jgi:CDP-6-deoxy-D-xylo-4-hexulose-3-dehydrase
MKILGRDLLGQKPQRQLGVGGLIISPRARELVNEVLESNRLSYGPMHERLERMFADIHDVKFSLFTNSGTSALQMALTALKIQYGWQEGDEVIVPAVTFVATANIVIQNGMTPVFVDVEPDTFNINPELIEEAITTRTRCIIPVHLLGLPADMEPILSIADRYGLKVIEDSCETMFMKYRDKPVGSMGDVGCFSTYVAHFVVTGVGGFCTTNDPELHITMKSLMNHGRDSIYLSIDDDKDLDSEKLKEVVAKRFNFVHVGYSYRCTELEAALGIAQLEEKDLIVNRRKNNAKYLTKGMNILSEYVQLPYEPSDREHGFMLYGIILKNGSKQHLVNYLEEYQIETRDLLPLVNQPVYLEMFGDDLEEKFPVAKYLNKQAFYIGCHHYFTLEDLDYIVEVFKSYFRKK